uniref:MIT domain-containing protein n=1 Tax=Schistocephalus solidus TaxID=70667 RepID=A0A183SVY4_SCHSO
MKRNRSLLEAWALQSVMSDNQLISVGAGLITRALELEEKSKLTESLVCYEEGIGLLIKGLRLCTDKNLKCSLKAKIDSYMTRAEELKELIKKRTAGGTYHEQIRISDGDTGFGYKRLFGRFLQYGTVTKVFVEDPYIRSSMQVNCQPRSTTLEKFSHFCEVVISSPSPVQRISLTTGQHSQNPTEQLEKLKILQQDLHARNVTFEWTFSSALHDRKIWFDNGWVVKVGRGLDYITPSSHKFVGLGVHDFDFRKCLQTDIDIYFLEKPPA